MEKIEKISEKRIRIRDIKDFEPDHVFDCGQCFRWNRCDDGSWTGTAGGRTVNVRRSGDDLVIDNTTEEEYRSFWHDYFDMDRDYGHIKRALSEGDPVMAEAVGYGHGIRLLKQDIRETVISFIISQNSNIPRIKKCIEGLCEKYGRPAGAYEGRSRYDFPEMDVLAGLSEEDLEDIRLGYRDRYVIETSRAIASDGGAALERAAGMPYSEAEKLIRSYRGVGPKVANCIMLFGLAQYESFPLDVWMKRVMSELYGFDIKDARGMAGYAKEHFGPYSGFAQQYLFYYARENLRQINNAAAVQNVQKFDKST